MDRRSCAHRHRGLSGGGHRNQHQRMDQACADKRLREPCWEGAQEARTGTVGTGLGRQRWAVGTSFWALSKLGAKVHQ